MARPPLPRCGAARRGAARRASCGPTAPPGAGRGGAFHGRRRRRRRRLAAGGATSPPTRAGAPPHPTPCSAPPTSGTGSGHATRATAGPHGDRHCPPTVPAAASVQRQPPPAPWSEPRAGRSPPSPRHGCTRAPARTGGGRGRGGGGGRHPYGRGGKATTPRISECWRRSAVDRGAAEDRPRGGRGRAAGATWTSGQRGGQCWEIGGGRRGGR